MTLDRYAELDKLASSATLSTQFLDVLERAIIGGTLRPGERIPVDDVAQHFGTSRIPVREALRGLEANGWVEMRPHVGAFVVPHTREELADLFEMRLLLEPTVARLAAQRRSAADLVALDREVIAGQASADGQDPTAFRLINTTFHTLVARCTRNKLLERVLISIVKRASFYLLEVPMGRVDRSAADHAELVEAIRLRDSEGAAEITERHIRETEHDVRARLAAIADGTDLPHPLD